MGEFMTKFMIKMCLGKELYRFGNEYIIFYVVIFFLNSHCRYRKQITITYFFYKSIESLLN